MVRPGSTVHDFGAESDNRLDPVFDAKMRLVMERYFSRDPKLWPCFAAAGFTRIAEFRRRRLPVEGRVQAWPDGERLQRELETETGIPAGSMPPGGTADAMLEFAAALSKDWENPASVENVVTMPCDPAIYGAMMGSMANPNLVYREYSGMADEVEKSVTRQIARLVGWDTERAAGLFTQGGTFCNLYGYLMGIRKSLPESREHGMGYVHDYRMINSLGGHYSNVTNLSVLGVDITTRTIRIKITDSNDIDLEDLERQLSACFQLRCAVPTIMLTMGTTDTFGVDRVKPVCEIVDRLVDKYEVPVRPHVHVDSAIGWTMLFFLGYDFEANELRINRRTLEGIRRNVERFAELRYADSFTVDFQKWGYVPYTSSLVMFRERDDLLYLRNDPENYCYFERDTQGHTHLQSTVECSRGGVGVFGAYAALKYLGVEGYRTLVAHCVQNANYFRYQLKKLGFVKVFATENQGPSVGFRMYDPDVVEDPEAEYEYEYHIRNDAEYIERVRRNDAWHRERFLQRGKVGLYTNWIEFVAHTGYDERGHVRRLPGEKAVFMNPATTRAEVDLFIENICRRT